MEFTIYSIGSAAYLEEILNAVAMISGTGDIEALAKVGMIIGVLILGFQAVMNGTGIQFRRCWSAQSCTLPCTGQQGVP